MSEKFIRPAHTLEEISGKELQPHERRRWLDRGKAVIVDMGPEYQRWLDDLRKESKQINIILQDEFEKRGIPFSTKRSHSEVLRFVVELRPTFVQSDEDKSSRFIGAEDQITIFIHLNADQSFQMTRSHTPAALRGDNTIYFGQEVMAGLEKRLKQIKIPGLNDITNAVIDTLEEGRYIKLFKEGVGVQDIAQAGAFYSNRDRFLHSSDILLRNLVRCSLRSILEHQAQGLVKTVEQGRAGEEMLHDSLQKITNEFLCLELASYRRGDSRNRPLSEFFPGDNPGLVDQLIRFTIKQLKPLIYGWENKKI